MEDNNIIFEPVDIDMSSQSKKEPVVFKQPIPGRYRNKYEELIEKCAPENFMDPYDAIKVDVANELYSLLLDTRVDDHPTLNVLRRRAVDELGIKISTERLYQELLRVCNPKQYTGDNYNRDLLSLSNEVYRLILQNADDIFALEDIWRQAQPIYDDYKCRQEELLQRKQEREKETLQRQQEREKADNKDFAVFIIFFLVVLFLTITIAVFCKL